MESKFKLSDIIQYILLGLVTCIMVYCIFKDEIFTRWGNDIQKHEIFISSLAIFISFSFLLLLYLLGVVIQSLKYYLGMHLYAKLYSKLGIYKDIAERGKQENRKIKTFREILFFLLFNIGAVLLRRVYFYIFRADSLPEVAFKLKRSAKIKKGRHSTPFWIIESKDPSLTVSVLAQYLSVEKKSYAANDFYNLAEFCQGLNFSSLVLGIISLLFYKIDYVIILSLFFIITFLLSKMFSYRFIFTLNIHAMALEIDMKQFLEKRFL